VYNTHVVVNDRGELVAEYRKIHLFDVNIPGQVTIQESASTAPGNQVVLCDSPIGTRRSESDGFGRLFVRKRSHEREFCVCAPGRLGLSTCYDVRFPELYAALVERGARVLLVPSAFTVPTGRAHWHVLLRGTVKAWQGVCARASSATGIALHWWRSHGSHVSLPSVQPGPSSASAT
jgi:deaminated glutathione amidase